MSRLEGVKEEWVPVLWFPDAPQGGGGTFVA